MVCDGDSNGSDEDDDDTDSNNDIKWLSGVLRFWNNHFGLNIFYFLNAYIKTWTEYVLSFLNP
jgi:hypothetical protein